MLEGNPWKLILIGFILVVVGVILPWLMIIDIIRSTFLMNLLAHGASVSGLFLGTIGMLMIVRVRRSKPLDERFQPPAWSDDEMEPKP